MQGNHTEAQAPAATATGVDRVKRAHAAPRVEEVDE